MRSETTRARQNYPHSGQGPRDHDRQETARPLQYGERCPKKFRIPTPQFLSGVGEVQGIPDGCQRAARLLTPLLLTNVRNVDLWDHFARLGPGVAMGSIPCFSITV
jgi:hypothetical protein